MTININTIRGSVSTSPPTSLSTEENQSQLTDFIHRTMQDSFVTNSERRDSFITDQMRDRIYGSLVRGEASISPTLRENRPPPQLSSINRPAPIPIDTRIFRDAISTAPDPWNQPITTGSPMDWGTTRFTSPLMSPSMSPLDVDLINTVQNILRKYLREILEVKVELKKEGSNITAKASLLFKGDSSVICSDSDFIDLDD